MTTHMAKLPPTHEGDVGSYRRPRHAPRSLFGPAIVKRAIADALRKLAPRLVAKNPVMFVVEVGSAVTRAVQKLICLARGAGAVIATGY